ncbi:hypothetical protein ACWDSF_06840 [Nocardia beijingensis]
MSTPVVPDRRGDIELAADTVDEFLTMLRRILAWSGMTAGQVASSSKLPRSTAYHFVSPKNTTLPSNPEQVQRFARACRLNEIQVAQVMRIWRELAGVGQELTSLPPSSPEPSHTPGVEKPTGRNESVVRYWKSFLDESEVVHTYIGRDGCTTCRSLTARQAKGRVNKVVYFHERDPRPTVAPAKSENLPPDVCSWKFRRHVLLLMLMALYPMIVTTLFGPQQPRLMYVGFFALALIGLIQGVFPWLNRTPLIPSAARLGAAAGLGSGAGVLAWAAVQMPFVGLLSGFLVFAAVPMWFAVMSQRWSVLFNTNRGIFVVITAMWFGALAGLLLTTTGGSLAGAALTGLIATAATLMELTARITALRHIKED